MTLWRSSSCLVEVEGPPRKSRRAENRTRCACALTPSPRGRLSDHRYSPAASERESSASSVTAKSQLAIAEILKVAMGTTALLASQAAEAAIDRLTLEDGTGCLDFGDDVAAREMVHAGTPMESVDGVEDGVSAGWAGVGKLGLQR